MTDPLDLEAAWADWCRRLAALGERIAGEEFPADPRTRAEGFRSLTRQLVVALRMEMEGGDPLHPEIVRHEDPWTQWGGPNPDNVYLRATIDPSETYRFWTDDVTGMREGIFSLQEGDMQLDQYGVFSERLLRDLEIIDGTLEITISPFEHSGNWMPSHPDARLFSLRTYVDDWTSDAVPTFHIERTSGDGAPPPPPSPDQVGGALERSVHWLESSVPYWNSFLGAAMERAPRNQLGPARAVPGGADNLRYGSAVWELGPDEALLITTPVPDAEYWGWTIHTVPWFESGDFANRQTSLSGSQLHTDEDELVRIVLSYGDPGVPNWIDTEGRAEGMVVFRLVGATDGIEPTGDVVPVDRVRNRLPADHPVVGAEERQAQLRRRRADVGRRLR